MFYSVHYKNGCLAASGLLLIFTQCIKFYKMKSFFKKLEHLFLVGSTKIADTSFPYKTATSETYVKTNRMVSTKWTYDKERSFASNYFIFLKFCFSLRTSCKELIWSTRDTNAHVSTIYKRWSFIWQWFFPKSVLNSASIS